MGRRGELVFNRVLTHIPSNSMRIRALRRLGASLGEHVYLFGDSEVLEAGNLSIAGRCHIGRYCQIDARGGIEIGWDVVIASHTLLVTADHDLRDPGFAGRLGAIVIEDRAWLASRTTVVRGVTIGEGAVVAAGAVVVADVEPWTIVAGVPARPIGRRPREQHYRIDHGPQWY